MDKRGLLSNSNLYLAFGLGRYIQKMRRENWCSKLLLGVGRNDLTPWMGTDATEVDEETHYPCANKVHHAMCKQLRTLVDRILRIFPDIEAARPGCTAGMQALCLLQGSIGKAKILLQNCSESSRFYLAITSDATLSRFERTRKQLVQSLNELQSMVPMNLKLEMTQIIDDLRSAVFILESSEQEAGKVVIALLQKDESILSLFGNSELRAVQFAASRLHLGSQKDLLIEKRSIKKMLDKVGDSDQSKRTILKYLNHLLRKHDKLVLEWQSHYPSINHDESFSSVMSDKKSIAGQFVDVESQLRHKLDEAQPDTQHSDVPPVEFKCPFSSRLMCDPVVIASGHTYERVFIEKWFDDGHDTCPTTGMKLSTLSLMPNTDMRNLISKWCKERGVDLYESTPHPSAFGSLETSSNSISSCSSLAGLRFQIDLSSVSLGSVDSCFNSDDFHPKNEGNFGLSRNNTSLAFKFFSSSREIETELLCNLSQLPWESQCMAIEDTQHYLDYNTHARVSLSLNNFMEPVVEFLMLACERQDTRSQIASSRLLLTGIRASRNAIRCMNEGMYARLASLVGTVITRDVLDIFELSVERSFGTKLAQSDALTSVIQILDTQYKEFHETAISILYNLSLSEDPCLHKFSPRMCIPRLVTFLKESSFSGRCIVILEKLFSTEEARFLAAETEGCIAAIVELLETGNCEEQEHALSILLSLCSQYEECCKLAMREGIIPSLFGIAVNGNDKGKVIASELLQLLRDISREDEQEDSAYNDDDDDVCRIPYSESEKVSSKRNGFFSKVATKLKKW